MSPFFKGGFKSRRLFEDKLVKEEKNESKDYHQSGRNPGGGIG
jgi:hypothetical protein